MSRVVNVTPPSLKRVSTHLSLIGVILVVNTVVLYLFGTLTLAHLAGLFAGALVWLTVVLTVKVVARLFRGSGAAPPMSQKIREHGDG